MDTNILEGEGHLIDTVTLARKDVSLDTTHLGNINYRSNYNHSDEQTKLLQYAYKYLDEECLDVMIDSLDFSEYEVLLAFMGKAKFTDMGKGLRNDILNSYDDHNISLDNISNMYNIDMNLIDYVVEEAGNMGRDVKRRESKEELNTINERLTYLRTEIVNYFLDNIAIHNQDIIDELYSLGLVKEVKETEFEFDKVVEITAENTSNESKDIAETLSTEKPNSLSDLLDSTQEEKERPHKEVTGKTEIKKLENYVESKPQEKIEQEFKHDLEDSIEKTNKVNLFKWTNYRKQKETDFISKIPVSYKKVERRYHNQEEFINSVLAMNDLTVMEELKTHFSKKELEQVLLGRTH